MKICRREETDMLPSMIVALMQSLNALKSAFSFVVILKPTVASILLTLAYEYCTSDMARLALVCCLVLIVTPSVYCVLPLTVPEALTELSQASTTLYLLSCR